MTKAPRFLASFAGWWRFEELAPDRTRVRFRYHLTARPRWLRWLLHPLLAAAFSWDTWKRLKALKKAAEKTDILMESLSIIAPEPSSWRCIMARRLSFIFFQEAVRAGCPFSHDFHNH